MLHPPHNCPSTRGNNEQNILGCLQGAASCIMTDVKDSLQDVSFKVNSHSTLMLLIISHIKL